MEWEWGCVGDRVGSVRRGRWTGRVAGSNQAGESRVVSMTDRCATMEPGGGAVGREGVCSEQSTVCARVSEVVERGREGEMYSARGSESRPPWRGEVRESVQLGHCSRWTRAQDPGFQSRRLRQRPPSLHSVLWYGAGPSPASREPAALPAAPPPRAHPLSSAHD